MVGIAATESGRTPRPVPSEPDGALSVRGGLGGIRFQHEELVQGAAALDGLANDLSELEREERAIWDQLCLSERGSRTYESRVSCELALEAIRVSWQSVARVRDELARIASDIRSSYWDYEAAEAWAASALGRASDASRWLEMSGGSGTARFSLRDSTESLVTGLSLLLGFPQGPGALAFAAAFAQASVKGGSRQALVRNTIQWIVESPAGADLRSRPIHVHPGRSTEEMVDASPSGILERLQRLGETTDGEIEVVQMDNKGGKSWIVIIPGTQTSQPTGGANPFDPGGIADGLGYGSQATAAAIHEALLEAGAKAGEQVAVAGYSQGGIHAMNLSQDKAFLADFDVKFVLTAGSPVGGIESAPGVSSLHLEHEHDVVPGADGLSNPDMKDRVTVTMSNPLSIPAAQEFGLGPGHKLSGYITGAEAVEESAAPSLVASTAALAGVVGVGGPGRVTRFRLEREPKPSRPAETRADHSHIRPQGGR